MVSKEIMALSDVFDLAELGLAEVIGTYETAVDEAEGKEKEEALKRLMNAKEYKIALAKSRLRWVK